MNIDDLIEKIRCGDETELRLGQKLYFLQPQYESQQERQSFEDSAYAYTVIYDCEDYENPTKIFIGTTEEIINYAFENKYTLKENSEKFEVLM
ncbi:MAG: hypothetical protein IKA64_07570 [Clostridia bacterium]|nr:hypothetical protein [Clostridia bacterium]